MAEVVAETDRAQWQRGGVAVKVTVTITVVGLRTWVIWPVTCPPSWMALPVI